MSDVECAQRTEAEVDKLAKKRERKRAYNAAYYTAHRDELLEKDRAYYAANRDEIREQQRAYRAANREELCERDRKQWLWFSRWITLLKATQGCADCGTHEGRLEYHHLDPSTKLYNVSGMHSHSEEVFLDEVAKCTVLCRSCHQKRHVELATNETC